MKSSRYLYHKFSKNTIDPCDNALNVHVRDRVRKSRDREKRSSAKIVNEGLMIDGGGHEDYFERGMGLQKFSQLEQQEVAIDRTFMNLMEIIH
jgi:hypothetical protein